MGIISRNPHDVITPEQWQELRERYPDEYVRDVFKALALAPDLEACRALLRGESVPVSRIDRTQARRFARR